MKGPVVMTGPFCSFPIVDNEDSLYDRVWRPDLIGLSIFIGGSDRAWIHEGNSFLPTGMYHSVSLTLME